MRLLRLLTRQKPSSSPQASLKQSHVIDSSSTGLPPLHQNSVPVASSGCTQSVLTDPDQPEPTSQPATPQQPPTLLCMHLSNCIDTFHANLQRDTRLATVGTSLDLMRLQMLIVGLASGTTAYGMK